MNDIIAAIDKEIAKLKEARDLLSSVPDVEALIKHRGRPLGSKKQAVTKKAASKRKMSAEGRAKIVAAQKERWAAKKAAV